MSADQIYARVIADSISPQGHRVTSIQANINRFVLAEVNTHRIIGGRSADEDSNDPGYMEEFSRNSASSRAIPLRKQLEKVRTKPAEPVVWPAEQKGMQGGEDLPMHVQADALQVWTEAASEAAKHAEALGALGVHKSVANRLLEPFLMHTVLLTATHWDGFFEQRVSPLAQPEIKAAAEAMKAVYDASEPTLLQDGEWHLPYITDEDREWAAYKYPDRVLGASAIPTLVRMSTARCARTSYETQDGRRDGMEDLDLYNRLMSASPKHWSPAEHPCAVWPENAQTVEGGFLNLDGQVQRFKTVKPVVGNLLGFRQHRFEMEVASS